MAISLRGVHVPHRKHTKDKPVLYMNDVKTVTIPMSMHIGKPARPCVKAGDLVCVGTKIGEADGAVSSAVYASVSGKVTKIKDFLLSNGAYCPAVVIESDGQMTPDQSLAVPEVQSREQLLDAIRESGVVGLGGAGFPTHVKFNTDPDRVQYLIINGAECEPYVTSDSVTMEQRGEDMAYALRVICTYYDIKNVIIGIESNKKKAIAAMKQLSTQLKDTCNFQVKVLPSMYPQGGEKVLVYKTVGRMIPVGKLPIDVGCIVVNCTTLAAIGEYLQTGMPLVRKCVTVDGATVKTPQNVIVPIGASMQDVFDFCGGLTAQPAKLIYGGPMMGVTVPGADAPIMKNTNAILALSEKEAKLPATTACIRCGACTNTCPFGLAPAAIAKAYDKKDAEMLDKLLVNGCMECGCCSFVCPANRPLVQTNKLAKVFLREEKAKEDAKK
ncbi:MAG: electron transport complex subunit RsxC [Clostridia bacterium]|nr:electron transport complex subunit RsxC [Clostridia bacterium]